MFCLLYPINGYDTQNNVPGVLYGRYPGDVYMGGNPWILTTAYLAANYYNAANEILRGAKEVNQEEMKSWGRHLTLKDNSDKYELA